MNNADSKSYISWRRMRQRINHRPSYAKLDIDPRWDNFKVFLADMGERPDGLSLERIDNTRGYWPDNCKWATMKEQSNNRRARIALDTTIRFRNGKIKVHSVTRTETDVIPIIPVEG